MIPIFILEPNQNQARPDQTQNGFDSSKMIWFQTNCILASTDLSVIKTSGKIQAMFLTRSKSRLGCTTPGQEPPVSSKAPIMDLKDMNVLWTFKIKRDNQTWYMGVLKTIDHT